MESSSWSSFHIHRDMLFEVLLVDDNVNEFFIVSSDQERGREEWGCVICDVMLSRAVQRCNPDPDRLLALVLNYMDVCVMLTRWGIWSSVKVRRK